jgi:hypothetical protein
MIKSRSKSPKRARPRVTKEFNGEANSAILGPSWMKSTLANANTEIPKTTPKKMRSAIAFLSTEGAKPILGTSIAMIFMIFSSCRHEVMAR